MNRLALLALLAFTACGPVHAQQAADSCAERALVVKRLQDRYGETLRSMGLNEDGVVEIYASDETGTWTILMSRPDGKSCLLAAGKLWEQNITPLGKPGDPA